MTKEFAATELKLAQDVNGRVPDDAVSVPSLHTPSGTTKPPFYTTSEPMYFRAAGPDQPAILLKVITDALVQSVVASPSTVTKFGGSGAAIEARRMTWGERIRNGAKAEVWLAVIASLVAVGAIVSAFVAPSEEKAVAQAEFAIQLHPIEEHLAAAISTNDPTAIKKAHDDLSAALGAHSKASDALSTWVKRISLSLGAVSAIIAICVAVKRARSTP